MAETSMTKWTSWFTTKKELLMSDAHISCRSDKFSCRSDKSAHKFIASRILFCSDVVELECFPAELNRGFPIVCERASLAALIRGSGGTKSMPKPYSDDLRERVIEAVVAGASRREAAESFNLSASSAVRWLQRWRDTGNARAKLSGGSTSPLEEHVEWLLA